MPRPTNKIHLGELKGNRSRHQFPLGPRPCLPRWVYYWRLLTTLPKAGHLDLLQEVTGSEVDSEPEALLEFHSDSDDGSDTLGIEELARELLNY